MPSETPGVEFPLLSYSGVSNNMFEKPVLRLHLLKVVLAVTRRERTPGVLDAYIPYCEMWPRVVLLLAPVPEALHSVRRNLQSLQKFWRGFFLADIQRGTFLFFLLGLQGGRYLINTDDRL